ncbi:MAG: tRNA guanosine(34) transglycosylase Tgt [Candidatus Bipolaricaulota bacterium]|nr:tRNA guanosine(34) transglycosylase Tgt [Candidatus Bipolaricaulota bacterium]
MDDVFRVLSEDCCTAARTGLLETQHGTVHTPAFVPVATQGTVKAIDPRTLNDIGVQIIIANAYHLHLRPGESLIHRLGGLHAFSGWQGPIMTDSGGFQVFSLGAGKLHGVGKVASIFPGKGKSGPHKQGKSLVEVGETGVTFRSIIDGSRHRFSPQGVIGLERKLGADIILVLDECTSPLHDYEYTRGAMQRTHRWAQRAIEEFFRPSAEMEFPNPGPILFGIVQGGAYQDLRAQSAEMIGGMDFGGIAIGGSLGRSKDEMHQVLDWTIPLLPAGKPRHLLGIGELEDIFAAVRRGVDTFDCASPTRIARNGTVFVSEGRRHRINLRNARFKDDPRPIDAGCDCETCKRYSRAYLHHLCRVRELSFYRLATIHNLRFLVNLMGEMREAIERGNFSEMERAWHATGR